MFLGAGLVLSGCGDDDTATTPAPAPPPPPPPAPEPEPEPEPPSAPATPTGFHVDTTQTSLTWHWNAVEGAIGYAVQISTDEMFDAEDTITPTVETSFTVADLPPQTTLYGRVAAAAGTLEAPILSAWTTHVTGTTDMPPPPPPPPMAPATPTGLMSEGGEGSITWSWDAVEGADGYAIQVSMDEMFDDMDETTYTAETSHTVSDLGYGEALYARVASTSGEGEDMLMSMWTTHMTGMSMEAPPPPMAPATPTGLMSETGEGSITWSWDEVEGALGYAIQVSTDEMFDDSDHLSLTMETSFTTPDPLPPGTTLYARVRSGTGTPEALAAALATGDISGLLLSAWTTHVTGMSAMAPPPPPPPALMVSFTIPKGKYPMEPDDQRNEATAKATVNKKITVSSNADASITPMFVDNANPVSVSAGDDNMPFAFVDWAAMQSDVVSEAGVTFKIVRDGTTGENAGDAAYVTCGPFRCTEGTDMMAMAPAITIDDSAVCAAWDPEVSLQVGFVDNNGGGYATDPNAAVTYSATRYAEPDPLAAGARANDGIDVGWVISSTADMTVEHHFNGVANGQNFSTSGVDASDGTSMALTMTNLSDTNRDATDSTSTGARIDDADFNGALFVGDLGGATSGDPVGPCVDARYDDPRSGLHKPDSCFRAVSAGTTTTGTDYFGGYSIELTAKDSGVSWGKVVWSSDTDPFKDVDDCESQEFSAMDAAEVDVCELFGDEVDRAMAKKWGGSRGTTVSFEAADSTSSRPATSAYTALPATDPGDATNLHLVALQIQAPAAESRRFASLWYNDNDKRADSRDRSNHNLYAATRDPLHIELVDKDGDPLYEDFGKVDFVKADGADAGLVNDFGENGVAESAAGGESACTHSDGDNCDGMLEAMVTVKFDAGLALGCSTTRDVMITCEWDANGEMGGYRADDHHTQVTAGQADDPAQDGSQAVTPTFAGFVTSPATGRSAGDIAAFVKCSVSAE